MNGGLERFHFLVLLCFYVVSFWFGLVWFGLFVCLFAFRVEEEKKL